MKKRKKKNILVGAIKVIFAGFFMIVLGTAGIDAVDNYDNISESIVGRLIFGESEGVCPSNMDFVEAAWGDFCIDKYEVSLSETCQYVNPKSANESKINIDDPKCRAFSMANAKPWTNLNQSQAVYACKKEGKRLPTNREWSMAAIGTPDKESGWSANDCQVANNWDSQPGLSGSGPNCQSFSGSIDMIGNVWEWVDASVEEGVFENRSLPQEGFVNGINESDAFPMETSQEAQILYNSDYFWIKDTKTRAIARGGYWNNKANAGQYSHYIVSTPLDATEAIGFRCVSNINNN